MDLRNNPIRVRIPEDLAGVRLDQALPRLLNGEVSRRAGRTVISEGAVFLDGQRVKVASRPVRSGQKLEVRLDCLQASSSRREHLDDLMAQVRIVHEDKDLVVAFKPAGIPAQGTASGDRSTLLNGVKKLIGVHRLFPIHRLDLETSGLMAVALNSPAAARLSEALRMGNMHRSYVAIAGGLLEGTFTVDLPIGDGEGLRRPAKTHFHAVKVPGSDLSIVRAELETGRTHQIRVHLASLGCPVLGDMRYGGRPGRRRDSMALHASVLELPDGGSLRRFVDPPPVSESAWQDVDQKTFMEIWKNLFP